MKKFCDFTIKRVGHGMSWWRVGENGWFLWNLVNAVQSYSNFFFPTRMLNALGKIELSRTTASWKIFFQTIRMSILSHISNMIQQS